MFAQPTSPGEPPGRTKLKGTPPREIESSQLHARPAHSDPSDCCCCRKSTRLCIGSCLMTIAFFPFSANLCRRKNQQFLFLLLLLRKTTNTHTHTIDKGGDIATTVLVGGHGTREGLRRSGVVWTLRMGGGGGVYVCVCVLQCGVLREAWPLVRPHWYSTNTQRKDPFLSLSLLTHLTMCVERRVRADESKHLRTCVLLVFFVLLGHQSRFILLLCVRLPSLHVRHNFMILFW